MATTLELKEETILTRDEVRELISSLPEGSIIDFSNVDFVSLSAAHEFRKIKEEKNFTFINMNTEVASIFLLDEQIRLKKSQQTSKGNFDSKKPNFEVLDFPLY